MAVLDGEPGIGKTRLAMKLAEEVHAEGAMVLWGRSSPEQLTPYQPVIEALREVITALQRAGRRVSSSALTKGCDSSSPSWWASPRTGR